MNDEDARDPLTGRILAAAFEVANTLGHGFLEAVYQRALAHELKNSGVQVEREVTFKTRYKGVDVGAYVADMVIENEVVVELKYAEHLAAAHTAQCLNYLKASGIRTGLLLNFGRPRVEFRRLVL